MFERNRQRQIQKAGDVALKLLKRKSIQLTLLILVLAIFMSVSVWNAFQDRQLLLDRYGDARDFLKDNKYQEAADAFSSLGDYKDSPLQLQQANYWIQFERASDMLAAGKLDAAEKVFSDLANTEDFKGQKKPVENWIK